MATQTSFAPGNVIQARRRLWRVDARQGEVLTATAIDGQTEQVQFYIPFEDIQLGELPLPFTIHNFRIHPSNGMRPGGRNSAPT